MASLDALIAAANLPRDARVVTIGRASQAAKNQIDLALENHKGPRLTIDDPSAEGETVAGDPFTIDLPAETDACFVTLAIARIPDSFEELLDHRLRGSLRTGGIAVLQFCRDASESALDRLNVSHANARAVLRDFLLHHFGTEKVGAGEIAAKFEGDGSFAFAGVASRTNRPVEEEALIWVVLKRRHSGDGGLKAFPRSGRADRYPQAEFAQLIEGLGAAGAAFVPVDEFARRLEGEAGGFGLLKFDIHHSIRRALEVGEILKRRNVPALFLTMHRHPLSADWYDAPFAWQSLRALQDMGHEVGLHLDPFHLVRAHGDLDAGVSAALAELRGHGLSIRAATLHGDTAQHLRARSLFAFDFFGELRFRSTWDGKAPDGEAFLAEHVNRYSFSDLAREHGLRWFAEANFVADGRVLSAQPLAYLSDNRRTVALLNTGEGEIADAAPFRISPEFAARAAGLLRSRPFLALFHPQWLW
ncbi:MAG TPA: hypothetical protein VG819_05755 [Rhizomicrobium sp.]|jgi:hypothetical protein|nr:hypothetical protein [Rhizomicrobium sp.]